jgi:Family of unknown function (DUF5898)
MRRLLLASHLPFHPSPYREVEQGEEEDNEEEDEKDFSATENLKRGTLYASSVISDGPQALKILAWVLGEMAASPVHHKPAYERDYLYVLQKDDAFGGCYAKLTHTRDYYKGKMPRSDNKTLYILEELGHRHHGRVYRAMSKNGNLCVLKYFVHNIETAATAAARKSVEYWNKAYHHDWLPAASCGKWGGGVAMIMPDLEKMSAASSIIDRDEALTMLKTTMKERFYEQGLWHGDPAWRNVAIVRNAKQGNKVSKVVMIDLEPGRMIEQTEHPNMWKDFSTMWEEFKRQLDHDWDSSSF